MSQKADTAPTFHKQNKLHDQAQCQMGNSVHIPKEDEKLQEGKVNF